VSGPYPGNAAGELIEWAKRHVDVHVRLLARWLDAQQSLDLWPGKVGDGLHVETVTYLISQRYGTSGPPSGPSSSSPS
jgi:hypothetical protein